MSHESREPDVAFSAEVGFYEPPFVLVTKLHANPRLFILFIVLYEIIADIRESFKCGFLMKAGV